jgi:hypothetical protein
LYKIPAVSALQARLNDLTGRISKLEEMVGSRPAGAAISRERDWVHSTMVTNLKDKIANLEERLARPDQCADDARALRQRVRDLEDYIKLGGHELPR